MRRKQSRREQGLFVAFLLLLGLLVAPPLSLPNRLFDHLDSRAAANSDSVEHSGPVLDEGSETSVGTATTASAGAIRVAKVADTNGTIYPRFGDLSSGTEVTGACSLTAAEPTMRFCMGSLEKKGKPILLGGVVDDTVASLNVEYPVGQDAPTGYVKDGIALVVLPTGLDRASVTIPTRIDAVDRAGKVVASFNPAELIAPSVDLVYSAG